MWYPPGGPGGAPDSDVWPMLSPNSHPVKEKFRRVSSHTAKLPRGAAAIPPQLGPPSKGRRTPSGQAASVRIRRTFLPFIRLGFDPAPKGFRRVAISLSAGFVTKITQYSQFYFCFLYNIFVKILLKSGIDFLPGVYYKKNRQFNTVRVKTIRNVPSSTGDGRPTRKGGVLCVYLTETDR